MKQIIINSEELQTRVAVVCDGVLHDFFMERNGDDHLVGSIFKGRIKNLEPSLQAAFVDIGCGKNAFLHYWDMIPATQDMLEGEGGDEDEEPQVSRRQQRQGRQASREQSADGEAPAVVQDGGSYQQRRRGPRPIQMEGSSEAPAPAPKKEEVQPQGLFARLCRFFTSSRKAETEKSESPAESQVAPGGSRRRQARPAQQDGQGGRQKQSRQVQQDGQGGQQRQSRPVQQDGQGGQQKPPRPVRKPAITVEDIPNLFKEGQEILVQVTKGPIGTKGARVTTNLSIPGRYLVLLPNSPHIGISKRVEERGERDRLRQMMKGLNIPKSMGVICRTVGAGMKPEHFQRDLDVLLDAWNNGMAIKNKRVPYCVYQEPDLAERSLRDCLTQDIDEIITDSKEIHDKAVELIGHYGLQDKVRVRMHESPTPIFNKMGLAQQLETVFSRKVNLPSGGYICIDETEALIAIDVNSGKNRNGKDQPETILNTNMEAVKEIARQLRLRNVGGLVVLDLIDMRSKKEQQDVYKALKDLMSEDRAKTKVYPISPLGLLEMTRQRENESLESTIFDNCPYCKGRGLVKSATSMSVEIQRRLNELCAKRKLKRLIVCAHPRILERLKNEDRKLFADIEMEHRADISFKADSDMHIEDYQILDATTGQKL